MGTKITALLRNAAAKSNSHASHPIFYMLYLSFSVLVTPLLCDPLSCTIPCHDTATLWCQITCYYKYPPDGRPPFLCDPFSITEGSGRARGGPLYRRFSLPLHYCWGTIFPKPHPPFLALSTSASGLQRMCHRWCWLCGCGQLLSCHTRCPHAGRPLPLPQTS